MFMGTDGLSTLMVERGRLLNTCASADAMIRACPLECLPASLPSFTGPPSPPASCLPNRKAMMGIAQKIARDFADAVRSRGQSYFAKGRVVITNHRPGAWFSLIRDPEGNTWEILQESPS